MFRFQGTLAMRVVAYNEHVSGTQNKFFTYYILNFYIYYIYIYF